ncbi:hypothetical protein QBC38DRAFT_107654 [Podospora fimiseda]|uniref:C2H2-type domain-containing protein n=1 Tax=Podospora fimiseda TaxID=252190 RepID=A0AAN6YNX5_9PEZI|nr:hypothetical protein QBC38DRAFT_107654 [Podospora fimiseda]
MSHSPEDIPLGEWHFEPNCPYRREQDTSYLPAVRLYETFADTTAGCFVGDSFDGRSWIDVAHHDECSDNCSCRLLHNQDRFYAFVVRKSPESMIIQINSPSLQLAIRRSLGSKTSLELYAPNGQHVDGSSSLNGLLLLQHFQKLVDSLRTMQQKHTEGAGTSANPTVSEMELFIYGLLANGEVFESYGHADLARKGRLPLKLWEAFKKQETNKYIDLLGDAYPDDYSRSNIQQEENNTNHQALAGSSERLADVTRPAATSAGSLQDSARTSLGEARQISSELERQCKAEYWSKYMHLLKPAGSSKQMDQGSLQALECLVCKHTPGKDEADDWKECYPRHSMAEALVCASRDGNKSCVDPLSKNLFLEVVLFPGLLSSSNSAALVNRLQVARNTALIEAVKGGHLKIVRMLIDSGAEIDTITSNQTPLGIVALEVKSETMAYMLLNEGADLHMAMAQIRQNIIDPAIVKRALQWLTLVGRRHHDDLEFISAAPQGKKRVARLRIAFEREHDYIKEVAAAASKRANESTTHAWWRDLEKDRRRAWFCAVQALRKTCNGTRPRTLHGVLWLLVLAKSMAVLDDESDKWYRYPLRFWGAEREFEIGLPSWELLFDTDFLRQTYRDAVQEIWVVRGRERDSCFEDPAFESFQQWVLNLFPNQNEEGSLYLGNHDFLWTQNQWRERQSGNHEGQNSNYGQERRHCGHLNKQHEKNHSLGSSSEINVEPGGTGGRGPPPQDDVVPAPSSQRSDALMMAFIMAGAIFAIILAFLLALKHDLIVTQPHCPQLDLCTPSYVQTRYLHNTVRYLINNVYVGATSPSILGRLEVSFSEAIDSGEVACFSDLRHFCHRNPLIQDTRLKDSLLLRLEQMTPTSTIQRSYEFLYAYLGLGLSDGVIKSVEKVFGKDSRDTVGNKAPSTEHPAEFANFQSHSAKRSTSSSSSSSGLEATNKRIRTDDSSPSYASSSARMPNIQQHHVQENDIDVRCSASNTLPSPEPSPPVSATPPTPLLVEAPISQASSTDKKTYCDECKCEFHTTSNYGKHRRGRKHANVRHSCRIPGCKKNFLRNDFRKSHEDTCRTRQPRLDLTPMLPGSFPR